MQQFDQRPRRTLSAGVVAHGAARPIQQLEIRILFNRWHFEIQPSRPGAAPLRNLPGIALPLHAVESALQFSRELAAHQHGIAPDIENIEHGLVANRADIDAGAASGASPNR